MPDAQASLGASDFEISMTLIGPNIVLAFGPLFVGPVCFTYVFKVYCYNFVFF